MGRSWEGLKPEVVCDAGPLIHLDEVDCLDLLADFERALVPEQIWDEALRHRTKSFESRSHFLRSIRRGQRTRSEVLSILRSIPIRSTLHIRRALLEEIVRQVEQSEDP